MSSVMEETPSGVLMPQRASRPPAAVADHNEVSMFERLARDPTVDVVKLQQLVELQERAEARSAKKAFAMAFASMQGEIPVIEKNGEIKVGREVRSTFARFEDIDRVIKPILQRHGFSLMHKRVFGEKALTVTSILMHSAGHSEETSFISPADTSGSKNAIQALGSTDSYGRRYNTVALLNIATSEDDDGQGSDEPAPRQEREPAGKPSYPADKFDANKRQWQQLMTSGTKTADAIVAMVSTKYTLTTEQLATIKSFGEKS